MTALGSGTAIKFKIKCRGKPSAKEIIMKMRFMSLAALGLASFMLSACKQENTRNDDILTLTTPKIEHLTGGTYIADRFLMIPFNENQPCTKDVFAVSRFNPYTNSIEICTKNEWKTAFVNVANIGNNGATCGKKTKKK